MFILSARKVHNPLGNHSKLLSTCRDWQAPWNVLEGREYLDCLMRFTAAAEAWGRGARGRDPHSCGPHSMWESVLGGCTCVLLVSCEFSLVAQQIS